MEYALLGGLVAVVVLAGIAALGGSLESLYNENTGDLGSALAP